MFERFEGEMSKPEKRFLLINCFDKSSSLENSREHQTLKKE